jgi:hypothetical protein
MVQSNIWAWKAALGLGEPLRFARRAELLEHNDESVLLIVSGLVKLTCDQLDGQGIAICLRGPGSVVWSEPKAYRITLSCTALTECLAYRTEKQRVLHELEKGGVFSRTAFRACEELTEALLLAAVESRSLTARKRLDLLTAQLSSHGILSASADAAGPRLRESEIAELLGISRSFLSRIRRVKPSVARSATTKR